MRIGELQPTTNALYMAHHAVMAMMETIIAIEQRFDLPPHLRMEPEFAQTEDDLSTSSSSFRYQVTTGIQLGESKDLAFPIIYALMQDEASSSDDDRAFLALRQRSREVKEVLRKRLRL